MWLEQWSVATLLERYDYYSGKFLRALVCSGMGAVKILLGKHMLLDSEFQMGPSPADRVAGIPVGPRCVNVV